MSTAPSSQEPSVRATGGLFSATEGTFCRAVDPEYRLEALAGSRDAGRYSSPQQPTLYLSSSRQGADTAMIAHGDRQTPELEIMELHVDAERLVDLRDPAARDAAGVTLDDALVPWQEIIARGEEPSSWAVRQRLEELGAHGLIDPSRKRPGLWHLVLFRWNRDTGPSVVVRDGGALS